MIGKRAPEERSECSFAANACRNETMRTGRYSLMNKAIGRRYEGHALACTYLTERGRQRLPRQTSLRGYDS